MEGEKIKARPSPRAGHPAFLSLISNEGSRRDRVVLPSFDPSCDASRGYIPRGKRGDSRRGIPSPRWDGGTCRDRPHLCDCEFRSLCARPRCRHESPDAERRDTPRAIHPSGPGPGTEPLPARVLRRLWRLLRRMSHPALRPKRKVLTISSSSMKPPCVPDPKRCKRWRFLLLRVRDFPGRTSGEDWGKRHSSSAFRVFANYDDGLLTEHVPHRVVSAIEHEDGGTPCGVPDRPSLRRA